MKILLINPYGSLSDEDWREYRTAGIHRKLNETGHEAIWVTSLFDSRKKIKRSIEQERYQNIKFIDSGSYKKNVSFSRLIFEFRYYLKVFLYFYKNRYDSILIVSPSMIYGSLFLIYSKLFKIKVIVDVLDVWPEHFDTVLSNRKKFFLNPLLAFLRYERNILCSYADLTLFCSKDYLDLVGHDRGTSKKKVRYIGSSRNKISIKSDTKYKISKSSISIIYAGTFGETYDMKSLIEAIRKLTINNLDFNFYFAGEGYYKDKIIQLCKQYPQKIFYLGILSPKDLDIVLSQVNIGMSTYVSDSKVSMPLKFFDYIAHGLYIINSLDGEISRIIDRHSIGVNYDASESDALYDTLKDTIINFNYNKSNSMNIFKQFESENELSKIVEDIVDITYQ